MGKLLVRRAKWKSLNTLRGKVQFTVIFMIMITMAEASRVVLIFFFPVNYKKQAKNSNNRNVMKDLYIENYNWEEGIRYI